MVLGDDTFFSHIVLWKCLVSLCTRLYTEGKDDLPDPVARLTVYYQEAKGGGATRLCWCYARSLASVNAMKAYNTK
jgi:hypothetical protein